ncbi:MAG TPA: hypothetical protein VJ754_04695 [Anaerolineae bacterium]|nr:hypothetical protein [Anaerolineae bacterium]
MRLTCVLIEHLPARVEVLLDPNLASKSLVILRGWDNQVIDASPEVIAAGVRIGDSLRRVEQLCPQAIILPAREAIYQAHHDRLKAVLGNFADAVETWALGEFFIEVGMLARTFPSDKALALQLAAQTQRDTRLLPTVGLASNKFTAGCAAREAARESSRAFVVADGKERQFLEPLPLAVLPDPPAELLRRLYLFGITTLGGLAQLPRAAFVRQFGPEMGFYHDLARGIDLRLLSPQSPPPLVTRELALPEPLADRRLVLAALEHLASGLARLLDQSGYHTLALALTVTTADHGEQSVGMPVKPPSANADLLRRLAGRLLGRLSFSSEVSGLNLTAYPLREWHAGARQLEMFTPAVQPKLARLHEALRVLRQRFGEAVVMLASALGPPLPLPIQVRAQSSGAPAWLSWGGWSRHVVKVYEYWRERRAWWDQPVTRDYYQVEVSEGTVFTLFQDGQGRWYLDRQRS